MAAYLIRKLEQFAKLSSEECQLLEQAARRRVASQAPGEDVVGEGEPPAGALLLLDGWACRYKTLEDGRRQIVAFLLPGDICDADVFLLSEMDHSIATLTAVVYAELAREDLQDIPARHPRLRQALAWDALVQSAIQREWIVSVGRRSALERVAHLLCELFLRLRAVGLTHGTSCELPLNQSDLADATGLSVVHVNRTLQQLRSGGLLRLHGRQMELPHLAALQRVALFNAGYLHLGREGRSLDATGL